MLFPLLLCLPLVHAFLPDDLFDQSGMSLYHYDITQTAVLKTAAHFFALQNPTALNAKNPDELFNTVFGGSSEKFKTVINQLARFTAAADHHSRTKADPVAHFDSEMVFQSHVRLQRSFHTTTELIDAGFYEDARSELASSLHLIQDFYAHTNWIELGQSQINKDLGIPGKPLHIRIANPNERTCRNCEDDYTERVKLGLHGLTTSKLFDDSLLSRLDSTSLYGCSENIITSDALTSGYYSIQYDEFGSFVGKPPPSVGKCSHGGLLDVGATFDARGGINKDVADSLFSPHDYLHSVAVQLALNASVHWMNELQNAVDDRTKFAAFLQLYPRSSVAVVFDLQMTADTFESMLSALEHHVRRNRDAEFSPQMYVFIPVRPELVGPIVSGSGEVAWMNNAFMGLRRLHSRLKAGRNKPVPMFEAVKAAAMKSLLGGSVYLLADSAVSDSHLLPYIRHLLSSRSLTLHLLAPARTTRLSPSVTFLSTLTGGRILPFRDGDEQSVLTVLDDEFDSPWTVILRAKTSTPEQLSFYIDSSITTFEVGARTFTDNPTIVLTNPVGETKEYAVAELRRFGFYHGIQLHHPLPGKWTVLFNQTEDYIYEGFDVTVRAKTAIKLDVDFFFVDSSPNTTHPGTHYELGTQKPLLVQSQVHLAVRPTSTDSLATPVLIALLDEQWQTMAQERLLSKGRNATYTTLTVPHSPFFVRVFGFDKRGARFERIHPRLFVPTTLSIALEAPHFLEPGADVLLNFTITNHQLITLVTVDVLDSHDWLLSYTPRTRLVSPEHPLKGTARLKVPNSAQDGMPNDVVIVVRGANRVQSNAYVHRMTVRKPQPYIDYA